MTVAFNTPTQTIPRNQWGQPLIVPPGGGKPIGYVRVSTMAKALDDTESLTKWKLRQAMIGVAQRPDLLALAAAKADDKTTMNRVAQEALDAANSSAAANTGTALHALAETVDLGHDISKAPREAQADIAAYVQATESLRVLAMEQFVVIDELQAAGSFDRLYQMPDGRVVVGDIKTGKDAPKYAHSAAAQMAMYAHGDLYDFATSTRHPLPMVDRTIGLLIHMPAGTGTCDIYEIDLTAGWVAAQMAKAIRDWRKAKPVKKWSAQ